MAKRVRIALSVPEDLQAELRDAAKYLSGPPYYLSQAQIAVDGIRKQLDYLKQACNQGKNFPKYQGPAKLLK